MIYIAFLASMTASGIQPRTQALAPPVDVQETITIDGKEYDVNIATLKEHQPKFGIYLGTLILMGLGGWSALFIYILGLPLFLKLVAGGLIIFLCWDIYNKLKGKNK